MKRELITKLIGTLLMGVWSFFALIFTQLRSLIAGFLFFLILGFFIGLAWIINVFEKLKSKNKTRTHGFFCVT